MSDLNLNDAIEFADNPEPRCPCVLVVDTSSSMRGERIEALHQGLETFKTALLNDKLAALRVDVAVVTFATKVRLAQPFRTADQFEVPELVAGGKTHIGAAITTALDLIEERKRSYLRNEIDYYRAWIFLLTDGAPHGETDEVVEAARERIRLEENSNSVCFFTIGFGDADVRRLANLSVREPIMLRGLNFEEIFLWVSKSVQLVALSGEEQDSLPPPPAV